MRTEGCNGRRVALFVVLALLAMGTGDRCRAQETGYSRRSHQPVLEAYQGWSLYWHDPFQASEASIRPQFQHTSTLPVWYSSAELLPLFRDQADERPFQTLGPDGDVVLGTGSFDAEFEGGTRVTLGRSLGSWYRLEGSWMGSYSWSDQRTVRNLDQYDLNGDGTLDPGTSGNLYSPFSGFGTPGVNPTGVLGLDFNRFAAIEFSSKLNSAEINVRRRVHVPQRRHGVGEASFLVGLRYMNINEDFDYLTASNVPPVLGAVNDVSIHTRNDMFGAQLGFQLQLLVADRAWVDVDAKGAVFANQADQSTVYTNTNNVGVTTVFPGQADANTTSFLGDLSVVFNYQVAPSLTFRAGYNAFWLTGVALGSENFNSDINILQLGPAALDHSGRVVYHGPNIGVVWAR